MRIGDQVKTIDGKTGKITRILEALQEKSVTGKIPHYEVEGTAGFYLGWQLTLENPKGCSYLRQDYCGFPGNCREQVLSSHELPPKCGAGSYLQRLQWAYVGTEHIFCPKCNKAIYEGHRCEESKQPLFICEKAKGYPLDCPAKEPHKNYAQVGWMCNAGKPVKCIPVEEKDWFVVTQFWPSYHSLTREQAMSQVRLEIGFRAFKWSQGVDSIDIHSW